MKGTPINKTWPVISLAVFFVTACERNPINTINDTMKKVSETANAIDSVSTRVTKEANTFAKHVEEYADTTSQTRTVEVEP